MRLLCVLLPHFPLNCEILRRRDMNHRRAAVIRPNDGTAGSRVVLDFSPELKGLQTGMPLQQVLSLHADIALLDADFLYYRAVFDEMLDALGK